MNEYREHFVEQVYDSKFNDENPPEKAKWRIRVSGHQDYVNVMKKDFPKITQGGTVYGKIGEFKGNWYLYKSKFEGPPKGNGKTTTTTAPRTEELMTLVNEILSLTHENRQMLLSLTATTTPGDSST